MAERADMVQSVLRPGAPESATEPASFSRAAAFVTAFTVLVVLFGAVVRVTGSGAGCGQHWPTCNGEIAHLPSRLETWIELGHRATSGLDFLMTLGLAVLAVRRFEASHPARWAAQAALGLMLVEIAIGAGLVLLNLVGKNASSHRALVMPAHLITTSLLLGSLALAAYYSSAARPSFLLPLERRHRARVAFFWAAGATALLLVVSVSGAITALGDTVYPLAGRTTLENLRSDHAAGAPLLTQVRALHPFLALLGVGALWAAAGRAIDAEAGPASYRLARALQLGGALALGVGLINISLEAPGYLQVIHLLVASLLWLSAVLLVATLGDAARGARGARPAALQPPSPEA